MTKEQNFDWITNEMFDRELDNLRDLDWFCVPGVRTLVMEYYNNDIIEQLCREHDRCADCGGELNDDYECPNCDPNVLSTEDAEALESDCAWAFKHWAALQDPCEEPDCETFNAEGDRVWPDCDCHSSEIIMLSTGYAVVWRDGDVVSGGAVIFTVGD